MIQVAWYWRACSLIGLLGLMILITLWNGWLTPVQHVPRSIELALLLMPLLLIVRGMFYNTGKANVYAIMLSLLYASLGFWYATSLDEKLYGYGLLVLSTILYVGSFMSARVIAKHNKALLLEGEATQS